MEILKFSGIFVDNPEYNIIYTNLNNFREMVEMDKTKKVEELVEQLFAAFRIANMDKVDDLEFDLVTITDTELPRDNDYWNSIPDSEEED